MHSPEPWTRYDADTELPYAGSSVSGPACIVDADGNAVVPDTAWIPSGFDIDRIVACVNACRGISTENLVRLINL
jgi:hypothetical protein